MTHEQRTSQFRTAVRHQQMLPLLLVLCCLSGLTTLLSACGAEQPGASHTTFTSAANQAISYSTDPHDVVIRTFYGGGLYGSLSLGPQVSIYGDGSYILGLTQKGQMQPDALQHLLSTLVDSDGLLTFKRTQFADIADQNSTFLELTVNGKTTELAYGSFGNQHESTQDMDEYNRLGKALTTLTESLKGPTQAYNTTATAILARQIFNPDLTTVQSYYSTDLVLAKVATLECGTLPADTTSPNQEIGCLKYSIPLNAQLLDDNQLQKLKNLLGHATQGDFLERGLYYSVTLRPLLPDESSKKTLAMFGSAQSTYKAIPLHSGAIA